MRLFAQCNLAYEFDAAVEAIAKVQVLGAPDQVGLRGVIGTNRVQIAVDCGGAPHDPDRVIVISSLDNLIKGAAGQAIQNLNLMSGISESAGLLGLRPL